MKIQVVKKIWYPGSASASKEWISYLQDTFNGMWFFSDMNNYTKWLRFTWKANEIKHT